MASRPPAATRAMPSAPTAKPTPSSSTPVRRRPTSSAPPTAAAPGPVLPRFQPPTAPTSPLTPPTPNIVYITFTDFNQPAGRIAGYKSTDGGVTWGSEFLIGDPISPPGYQQSSQPRVASNGWIYVGYQEYNDQNVGCAAGVRNEVARSTDGGATWTITAELNIVQGGACSNAQAGRGIFCINAGGSSFRSRSHPIMGISPTDPSHVYMVYSGGDLESAYSCGGSTGFHGDTLFRRSTDAGVTWTAPAKINTDPQGEGPILPLDERAAPTARSGSAGTTAATTPTTS